MPTHCTTPSSSLVYRCNVQQLAVALVSSYSSATIAHAPDIHCARWHLMHAPVTTVHVLLALERLRSISAFGALPKLTTSGCTCCKAWWGKTTVLAAAHIIGPLVFDVLCVFWDFSVCGRKYFPLDIAKAALGCALEEKAVSTIANGRSIAMCTRQRATHGLVEGRDVEGARVLER